MSTIYQTRPLPVTVPVAYAIFSAVWIMASDRVLVSQTTEALPHTFKGLLFIAVTTVLLYLLIRRHTRRHCEYQRHLEETERMRQLGEIAARISHDFRNVLMTCKCFSDLLRREAGNSPKAVQAVDHLQAAIRRGQEMIGEILGYAAPRLPQRESILLESWLTEFAEDARMLAGRRATVNVAVIPAESALMVDPVQFHQLLSNLVVNAAEAVLPTGLIEVAAERTSEKRLRITVRDNGPGMSSEVRSRIFQPLFTTKKSGTGLGLAIVQRIAHDHGATVSVASDLGRGTSFHIDFPTDQPSLGLALVS